MSSIKGWKTSSVKDLCHLGRGRVISGQEIEQNPGIYPVYSSQSKDHGKMGAIDTFDFDGEYVTWTTDGAYAGTVFYRNGKFNCTNVCGTLSAKESELDLKFLAYKLSTVAKNHVSYIGNPKLMNGVMAGVEIDLPERKIEQTKIAEILSTLDRAIEQTEALIAKQQRIKTGLMQDLLTKGIDAHGNIRSEATHAVKDSPLGRISVEWDVFPLEELATQIVDCPHTTPNFTPEGMVVIRTFNIKDGQFFGDRYYISESEYRKRVSRLTPEYRDVVFTREAPVGEAFIIPQDMRLCLGQRTMLIRPKEVRLNAEFFVDVVYSEEMRIRFDQIVGGTTNPHLNVADIRRLSIKVPPYHEQKKISRTISSIRTVIKTIQESNEKLQHLKRGLMHDLLTGKRRITSLLSQTDN